MPTTAAYLESYGVSLDQARTFIWDNLSNPSTIFNTAKLFGLTNQMLADIVSVNASDVRSFWSSVGFNATELEPSLTALPLGYESIDSTYFQIVTGTSGEDTFTHTWGNKIYFGFGGDDHFSNSMLSEGVAVFVGGDGEDTYEVFPAGENFVFDLGGGVETFIAYSLPFEGETYTLNGQYLISDVINHYTDDLSTIVVGNLRQSNDAIENVVDPYTNETTNGDAFIVEVTSWSGYQGNLSISDLGLPGLAISEGYQDLVGIYQQYLDAGF